MKAIYSIGCPFNYSGLGKTAYYQTLAIRDLGIELKVFAPCFNSNNLNDIKVRSFLFNPLLGKIHGRISNYYYKDLIFDNWVSDKLDNEDCDIFWGWSSHCLGTMKLLRSRQKIPIMLLERQSLEVQTQKNIIEEEYKRLGMKFNLITEDILKRNLNEQELTDYFMVSSNFIAESFINIGIERSKIKVNPLGVDIIRFSNVKLREDDVFRIVYVGMITIRKGIHKLIEVWKKLNLKKSELILVGRFYPKEKSFFNNIFFDCPNLIRINGTSCPEEYYRKSSIFVIPSVEDGFGSVVLEAMASGLPVIVSDRVGAKECVVNGVNGFIYDYDNLEELADKILYFYNNRDFLQKFGDSARKHIQKYSWENYIDREKNILKEIIDECIN